MSNIFIEILAVQLYESNVRAKANEQWQDNYITDGDSDAAFKAFISASPWHDLSTIDQDYWRGKALKTLPAEDATRGRAA